jgi:hypothetical protein
MKPMGKKEMLAIADRVQKRIQGQRPEFRFIAKRDEIEKEFINTRKVDLNIEMKE